MESANDGVYIQDPDKPVINDAENTLDTLYINNASVVSSGDYQRYYIHEGKEISSYNRSRYPYAG